MSQERVMYNLCSLAGPISHLSILPNLPAFADSIDLLLGATLSTSRLYCLTKPELEAMENNITACIVAGIIETYSGPVGARLFFLLKRNTSLFVPVQTSMVSTK